MFRALARGEKAAESDSAASRLGEMFDLANRWTGGVRLGTNVSIRETGIVNTPANPHHAALPTHAVRFSYDMHDDHYANGGYALPFVAFDLVGQHGLYCTSYDDTNRQTITHYFREFDDLIIQSINVPSMAYPLPPAAEGNRDRYLRGWSPASAGGFRLEAFTRIPPDEREKIVQDARSAMGLTPG
ncbi:MAG: hypothetical protein ACRCTI_09260 [Beijerinckiaceae bacterium]